MSDLAIDRIIPVCEMVLLVLWCSKIHLLQSLRQDSIVTLFYLQEEEKEEEEEATIKQRETGTRCDVHKLTLTDER